MTLDLQNRLKLTERAIASVHPKTQCVGIAAYFQAFLDLARNDGSQANQECVELAQDQGIPYPCDHDGAKACQSRSFDTDSIFFRRHKPAPAHTHGSVTYGFISRCRRIKSAS